MAITAKRFSPAASTALQDALSKVFWYKDDLKKFLSGCLDDPLIITRLDWNAKKYWIVGELVAYLVQHQNQDRYFQALETLCDEVCKLDEGFRNLARLEDGDKKVKDAREAQAALRKVWSSHVRAVDSEEASESRRKAQLVRQMANDGFRAKVDAVKDRYFSFVMSDAKQRRGYELEKMMYDLFNLFDLDPKASFKVEGEQIDGGFSLEGTDYILEAKWRGELTPLSDLQMFSSRVHGRLRNALGVFLSINGYEDSAKTRAWSGEKNFLLMEGQDLVAVLEGRIDLTSLLVRKRKHASHAASPYLSINDII